MYNLTTAIEKGRIFRQNFDEIDFVGEIEIPEAELNILCDTVWKFRSYASYNEDIRALLATVVINLAYYTREEIKSDSLRWLVLHKLSKSAIEDVHLWQNEIGFPILQILKKHFQIEELIGPNRYVRPILQQAGVPFTSIPQFTKFFLQLVNKFGFSFTHHNYQKFREGHQIQSKRLSEFLGTEVGLHYCQEIGRIYKNLRNDLLKASEIELLSPRLRETVKALYSKDKTIATSRIENIAIRFPQLALDKESLRLKLLFPEEAVNSSQLNYEIDGIGKIRQTSYFISPEQVTKGRISGTAQYENETEEWEVNLWQPQITSWAVFSVSSGVFIQSGGSIEAGEYLVVIPFGINIPSIIEDLGYFHLPGNTTYKVFHADLEEDFEIPDLNLKVGKSLEPVPYLKFANPGNSLRYGTNLFVGQCPKIIVSNWDNRKAQDYLLLLEKDGVVSRLDYSQVKAGLLELSFELPAKIKLKLEPKGKMPRSFSQSELTFTVLPSDFRIDWKNILYEKNYSPTLKLKPADKVEVIGRNVYLKPVESGHWQIAPECEFINPQLKYENFSVFFLDVPVYRLIVTSESIENNILWQEKINQKSTISISCSPNESRQNIEIGIINSNKFVKICDSKRVPANFFLELTTAEVKDAFADCGIPAGLIAIRNRTGRIIHSDIIYANEELIKDRIFDEKSEFDKWSKFLPEDLLLQLKAKRRSHLAQTFIAEEKTANVPTILKNLIEDSRPNFEATKKSLVEWSRACRNQYWQKAQQTEVGNETEGKIITDAVRTYHDALFALEDNKEIKHDKFLISAYHKLQRIDPGEGLISQIAVFLRLMCCLRLNEIGDAEREIKLLNDEWNSIKLKLNNKILTDLLEDVNLEEMFDIDDVLIHKKDLELFDTN